MMAPPPVGDWTTTTLAPAVVAGVAPAKVMLPVWDGSPNGDGAGSRAVDLLSARSGEDLGQHGVADGQACPSGVDTDADGLARLCRANDHPARRGDGTRAGKLAHRGEFWW